MALASHDWSNCHKIQATYLVTLFQYHTALTNDYTTEPYLCLCFVPIHWLVIVKFMHFVNITQYPVQPVALYITEHNACILGGWGSVRMC